MADAGADGPPTWAPTPHLPQRVLCGGRCPGERRGGKRTAAHGALGPADCAAPRRALVAPTSNLEISPAPRGAGRPTPANDSYLVDSASSHMLVSKIKPCMSKYKQLYSETANGSLYKLSFI